jgi:hypothetical protein
MFVYAIIHLLSYFTLELILGRELNTSKRIVMFLGAPIFFTVWLGAYIFFLVKYLIEYYRK